MPRYVNAYVRTFQYGQHWEKNNTSTLLSSTISKLLFTGELRTYGTYYSKRCEGHADKKKFNERDEHVLM